MIFLLRCGIGVGVIIFGVGLFCCFFVFKHADDFAIASIPAMLVAIGVVAGGFSICDGCFNKIKKIERDNKMQKLKDLIDNNAPLSEIHKIFNY